MHLPHPFYKFPFRFDVARLRAEVEALPEEAWQWHHQGFAGNSALHLISTHGGLNDDFEPPMRPTEYLAQCPYILQVLAQFQTLHGRARLMRLEPGHGVPAHVDQKYYWRTHTRVHIPIITHPDILFHCGPEAVHMAAGEAWTFDNWRIHKVVNDTGTRRIHLTFDTYGSSDFWAMARPPGEQQEAAFVPFRQGERTQLAYEGYVGAPVLSPAEVELDLNRLVGDAAAFPQNDPAAIARLRAFTGNLINEWRLIWFAKGPSPEGIAVFEPLLRQAQEVALGIPDSLRLASNGWPAGKAILATLTAMVRSPTAASDEGVARAPDETTTFQPQAPAIAPTRLPRFDRPIFIVAAPRSGSTMLYETLAVHEGFWTLGGEGHNQLESIAALAPRNRGFTSNRLTAEDASADARAQLHANYTDGLRDAASRPYVDFRSSAPESVRFLEKTPKNALRIPFLKAAYPDAKFIFLHRDAKSNISSIMEAWRARTFITYPNLPDWPDMPWSLLLIPGWRELAGKSLVEIALRQWRDTNDIILDDLAELRREDWCAVRYEDLTAYRRSTLKKLCAFSGVEFTERMQRAAQQPAPLSRYTLTPPSQDKWRTNEAEIQTVLPQAEATARRLAALDTGVIARRDRMVDASQG